MQAHSKFMETTRLSTLGGGVHSKFTSANTISADGEHLNSLVNYAMDKGLDIKKNLKLDLRKTQT